VLFRSRGLSLLHNAVLQDLALTCGLYGTVFLIWGARAATFVAAQSGIAIIVLELFNYVAHYGLSRRMAAGAVERLSDRHSWNSPGLGNLLMFNMGHHSHHHRAPSISYDGLRAAIAPELPYGYSGSILLALIPSLWRRIMDPRVYELRGENFDPPRAPAGEIASAAL